MKFVLVDTSVWSLAFRKKRPDSHDKKLIEYLTFFIRNHYAIMIGPIRQEILSGISDEHKFRKLQEALKAFPDFVVDVGYKTAKSPRIKTKKGISKALNSLNFALKGIFVLTSFYSSSFTQALKDWLSFNFKLPTLKNEKRVR